MERILSRYTASISELKRNPAALLRKAAGEPIAILNHNSPTAYLVPVEVYEAMYEIIEDEELAEVVRKRLAMQETPIDVDINQI